MLEEISFPEHEYESIQNYLNKLGSAPQLAKYDVAQKTK